MTITKLPVYPALAKNSAWQKTKSFRDKVKKSTKTGLGTLLVAAERAFGNIKFDKLDVKRLQKATGKKLASYGAVDLAKVAAQQHLNGPVTLAHAAVEAAAIKASAVGSNQALSVRAGLAADTIAANLRTLALAIDPTNISLDDFDAHKKVIDADSERSHVLVRRTFPALRHAAELVEALPTVVGYSGSGFHKAVMAVNTALTKSTDITLKVWGEQNWAALAKPAFLPKQDGVVLKKVNQVLAALSELEDLVN